MGNLLGDIGTYMVLGLITAAAYAIASSGVVITYATSNVFNMAHGAIGMVMAFTYWQLVDPWGVPSWIAAPLVVLVIAPLFGALLERTMMRHLTNASVTVSLTVTVGLFVMLLGMAQKIWSPGVARSVEPFFPGVSVTIGDVTLSAHQLLTLGLAAAVAGGLYLLLNRTRTGIGMRAIVDNRTLLALHGARPEYLGMLSWAIGASLAALAGVMLASQLPFDNLVLTLVVINAFAAAMVGRLKSLPRTFMGAVILGELIELVRGLSPRIPAAVTDIGWAKDLIGGATAALPTIVLFGAMLALPQERLRVGRVEGATLVRLPSRRRTVLFGLLLVAAVAVGTRFLAPGDTSALAVGFGQACIMLSLVLLAGYGGDMSLAQLTFAGFGVLTVVKWGAGIFHGEISLEAMLAAAVVCAIIGAVTALPALRLRGLYLGLGTLAFAVAMDEMIFKKDAFGFQLGGSVDVVRPSLLGHSFQSEPAAAVFIAIVFCILAAIVLELRRSRFGRLLLASRDSPAACGTLGQSITVTRVATFAIAAGIAGIGGLMVATAQVSIGATDFEMIRNLPLLLLVVIGGVTSVSGALIGGLLLGLQSVMPSTGGLDQLFIGVAAVLIGRNPNGVAGALFAAGRRVLAGRDDAPDEAPQPAAEPEDLEEVTVVGAS